MRVLIVDDDVSARRLLRRYMASVDEVEIHEASSLSSARQALARHAFDAVLIDLCLDERDRKDRDGLNLVREVRAQSSAAPIVVTAASQMADIREAIRLGAHSYILKDELSPELVLPVLRGLASRQALESEVLDLHGLVGSSAPMERLRRTLRRVAESDGPVVILGPSGSGKELVARAIHALSPRRGKPLVTLNCSTVTDSLAEAQLFGYERGYFTGADKARVGFIGEADTGTLFLDEIAELALPLQAKLLRVLENRTYRVLGAQADSRFNGRVLAATHVDLAQRRAEGRFRDDLFYRLEVLTVHIPALDERKEDIPALAEHFAREAQRPITLSDGAKDALMQMSWPGNVRELRNLVHRLAVLVESEVIESTDVHAYRAAPHKDKDKRPTVDDRPGALALVAGLSPRASKKQNVSRLLQNQIQMLEADGLSVEEICDILHVGRSSFFRMRSGQGDGEKG